MKTEKLTASLEDYIEAIYEIIKEKNGVRAIDIAKRVGVNRSSVTEALKVLASKGYVNYARYDVISLTSQGEKKAIDISKKHQFLYKFFIEKLGVSPDEASINACKIEHSISDNVFEKLMDYINQNN